MKTNYFKTLLIFLTVIFWPGVLSAQGFTGEIHSLQSILDQVYAEMLPLCNKLIGVGRGLAGFAALWYISSRVWRHLANAEPVDFYPLLRPFALGFCVLIFPYVLALINGILQPTVTGTAEMVTGSNNAIAYLLKMKEDFIQKSPAWQMYVGESGSGDRDKWYKYTHPEGTREGALDGLGNDIKFAMAKADFNFRNATKGWMSEVLQILYEAAGLCINTIRTFYLIVLAILGPLIFGLAVFDGFQHTLTIWLSRYINVFLWLPVANIFGAIIGKVQENMLRHDLQEIIQYGDSIFSPTDSAYIIFLVMGIVGYFTVPSVANYIVSASGGNTLLFKASGLVTGSAGTMTNAVLTGGRSFLATGLEASQSGASMASQGGTQSSTGESGSYMRDKLAGNKKES